MSERKERISLKDLPQDCGCYLPIINYQRCSSCAVSNIPVFLASISAVHAQAPHLDHRHLHHGDKVGMQAVFISA